jgi:2-polyprenyl-3-methyl-5-hydroxy-6-metoxy-1,4-benzoquinol methylase
MDNKTEISVSNSLETVPDFLPYLPELLVDLWALGSSPRSIIGILSPLSLSSAKTRVLDLGCGKGAVSITIAHQLGFSVTGIDASEVFLEVARKKAQEYHVSDLCKFELADIFEFIKSPATFNVVILASLGGILGTFEQCVKQLRQLIIPGGYIIIDDDYLREGAFVKRKGYDHYVDHDETIRQLTVHGDFLIKEVSTDEESKTINAQYLTAIKKRAKVFIKKYPHLAEKVRQYIHTQEIECEVIDKNLCGAVWLLQRRK